MQSALLHYSCTIPALFLHYCTTALLHSLLSPFPPIKSKSKSCPLCHSHRSLISRDLSPVTLPPPNRQSASSTIAASLLACIRFGIFLLQACSGFRTPSFPQSPIQRKSHSFRHVTTAPLHDSILSSPSTLPLTASGGAVSSGAGNSNSLGEVRSMRQASCVVANKKPPPKYFWSTLAPLRSLTLF